MFMIMQFPGASVKWERSLDLGRHHVLHIYRWSPNRRVAVPVLTKRIARGNLYASLCLSSCGLYHDKVIIGGGKISVHTVSTWLPATAKPTLCFVAEPLLALVFQSCGA